MLAEGLRRWQTPRGRALGQRLRKTELGHDLGCEKFKLVQSFVARNQSPVEEPNQILQRYLLQQLFHLPFYVVDGAGY
jgi:hypothetical protein